MKNCKSLTALRDYFTEKENSDIEVSEDLEVHRNDNPMNFFSDFLNTKSPVNQ